MASHVNGEIAVPATPGKFERESNGEIAVEADVQIIE